MTFHNTNTNSMAAIISQVLLIWNGPNLKGSILSNLQHLSGQHLSWDICLVFSQQFFEFFFVLNIFSGRFFWHFFFILWTKKMFWQIFFEQFIFLTPNVLDLQVFGIKLFLDVIIFNSIFFSPGIFINQYFFLHFIFIKVLWLIF